MLRSNTVLKILSLLIAIFLWVYVMGEVDPTTSTTIKDVPVKLQHLDALEEKDLAVKGSQQFSVDVVIEGSRAELNRLDRSEIKAEADLFGYEKGKNQVPVQVSVPENVTLKDIKTPRIEVVLEELVSDYKTIEVSFRGDTEEDTEPGEVECSPAEIEVKGGKSAVKSVESVRVEIRAAELTDELQTFSVKPKAYDKNGKHVTNVEFSTEMVDVRAILHHTKTIQISGNEIELKNVGQDLEAVVRTAKVSVTATGQKTQIEPLSKDDFQLSVDLKQKKAGTYHVPLQIKNSESLTEVKLEPESVEIVIKNKSS